MNIYPITRYTASKYKAVVDFEEAFFDSSLQYSLRRLAFTENISHENMMHALYRVLQLCSLVGANSKHHFKQIYVYDENTGELYADWLMSKKGFTLIIMQASSLNKKIAEWLWELAEL